MVTEKDTQQEQAPSYGDGDEDEKDDFDKALNQLLLNDENLEKAYHNCDCVLGSVAEVERLWRLCKYFLTQGKLLFQTYLKQFF